MRRNGLLSGACYAVGDGKSINIWLDSWVPWIEGYKPKRKDDSVEPNPLVVEKLLTLVLGNGGKIGCNNYLTKNPLRESTKLRSQLDQYQTNYMGQRPQRAVHSQVSL
jgi:hypothetical protein